MAHDLPTLPLVEDATAPATRRPLRRALLSVYDKTGIADFARDLSALGWELFSTGQTQATIAAGPSQAPRKTDIAS